MREERSSELAVTQSSDKMLLLKKVGFFQLMAGSVSVSGQSNEATREAIVGLTQAGLIASQALYLGLAASLGGHSKKWRQMQDSRRVLLAKIVLFIIGIAQIVSMLLLVFYGSWKNVNSEWNDLIQTAGPGAFVPHAVFEYSLGYGYSRSSARHSRNYIDWDNAGNGYLVKLWFTLPGAISFVLHLMYLALSAAVIDVNGNYYPFVSAAVLYALLYVLHAVPELGRTIASISDQSAERPTGKELCIPVVSRSDSTSMIYISAVTGGFQVRRLQSMIQHTMWGLDGRFSKLKASFGTIDGSDAQIRSMMMSRFAGLRELIMEYGTHVSLDEGFAECLKSSYGVIGNRELFTGHSTYSYCFVRAVVEEAVLRVQEKKGEVMDRLPVVCKTLGDILEVCVGKNVNLEVRSLSGRVVPPSVFEDCFAMVKDRVDCFIVAAVFLRCMAMSKDLRVVNVDTMAGGRDVVVKVVGGKFSTRKVGKDGVSELFGSYPHLDSYSAPDAIRQMDVLKFGSGVAYDLCSAEHVAASRTSERVWYQHVLKYMCYYFAASVVFVIFGQTLSSRGT